MDVGQGESGDHFALRGRVVTFMRQHPGDFAPFIEEDEQFEHYCKRMAKACTSFLALDIPPQSMRYLNTIWSLAASC